MGDGGELPSAPYGSIKVVFTDLDGTLYPGSHEEQPLAEKPGLMRNMAQVARLEAMGVPVVPATGNNVVFAQAKLLCPRTGEKLRDLRTTPGIYCNGALVKGAGGREVDVQHLAAFLPGFVAAWCRGEAPRCADICIAGLGKERIYCLRWFGLGAAGERTANEFFTLMMAPEHDVDWMEPKAFSEVGECVLSLLILLPTDWGQQGLLDMQKWLQDSGLFSFALAAERLSNGEGDGVVCKHVHVPGLGPEIDISPTGVNKGSAIAKLLEQPELHLGVALARDGGEVAVFGDAANDVELFGMRRDRTGEALEPLDVHYRPSIRCAMPWANDKLLIADATMQARMDLVLARIAEALKGASSGS